MTRVYAILLIAGAMLAAPIVRSQEQTPRVFRAESELVVLNVNVMDHRSRPVPGLTREAFEIVEDGVVQRITFFDNTDVPVSTGLVLDNSSSMLTRQRAVLAGARAFAESSNPGDEVFTIIFNEHVRHGLPPGVLFTHNPVLVQSTLSLYRAGGMTALHDAVIAAIDHLEHASRQRQVLVVLSDGEDNASRQSAATMLERAARSDARIFTISTARLASSRGNERLLRRLATSSGAVSYAPPSEEALIRAFQEIAGNVRSGYSLGYTPTNSSHDGGYRRVDVNVQAAGYRNLRANARDGYYAPDHDDAR